MPKVKEKALTKDSLLPKPMGPGPQPPPICTAHELAVCAGNMFQLIEDHPTLTLRKVWAALSYLIDKQQWDEGSR